jgi:hypothetical protein
MNIILTGCDKNTEWQLPWFVENFKKFCAGTDCKLAIADFGMTTEAYMMAQIDADYVIDFEGEGGWFNKVKLFNSTHTFFGEDANICWLDTDCELKRCPHTIFNYIEENKLTMVVDHPWTEKGSPWTPQGNCGPWYNTGVVAYRGRPPYPLPVDERVRDRQSPRRPRGTLLHTESRSNEKSGQCCRSIASIQCSSIGSVTRESP